MGDAIRGSDEPPPGAFIVINGRRWRASDPSIPPTLRQELVDELMDARRAVRDATDDEDKRLARRRVNDAKVALGERGRAWWLDDDAAALAVRIEAAMRALLRSRRSGASICPSDVARIVGGSRWRRVLGAIRAQAVAMAAAGDIEVMRGRRVITSNQTAGVLRYRLMDSERS